ncbi:uncharacterized protein LOC131631232 [Vicia villosa]|uniref:uncharacterized protein LOC131631232 n=1 Tax=Vicia villosa TaxID=3911 RepID=UPI00273BD620|nr:uncharacterized protein LOC131631232 [Vicia villosa]
MTKNPNFNYHNKCEKLGITHLAFANDVLLFSRGDCKSIEMLLEAFKTSSDSTGLIVNPKKCKVFYGGMDTDTKQMVKHLTGYEEGQLPIRYLGIPLSSKKLNINHYMPMIDRIVSRI